MQAIFGLAVLLFVCWLGSEARSQVSWRFVAMGLLFQTVIALLLLKVTWVAELLLSLNVLIESIEEATRAGTVFLFGFLGGDRFPVALDTPEGPYLFAFRVLPQVVVFSVIVALLWHWKVLSIIVRGLSWALRNTLKVSGTVAAAAAASLFLGMIETPLVIRAYLARLTRSEFFTVMTLGMSTVAGSVMVLFAALLADVMEGVIGHILTASMINAIGALYISRILVPEDRTISTQDIEIDLGYISSMDALAQGTKDGLALAVNVGAMLLVLISFVALGNIILDHLSPSGMTLTIQGTLGMLFAPIAWLIGIPWHEAIPAGGLLGTKLVLNELVAYIQLAEISGQFSAQSQLILIYALCGFANVGSLGVLIGGLSVLVPKRKAEYLAIAPKSVLAGTAVTLVTGALVGLISAL